MRRMKKLSFLVLGIIPLLLLTTFLPAGAVTTENRKAEDHSSELVVCETDAAGIIQNVRVFDTLGIMETSGGGSVDFKEEYKYAGENPEQITGFNSFAKPVVDGDYLVWKGVDTGTDSNTVADIKFSKAMVDEAKTRIPLKVNYQYYFDGKKVEGPEAIAGKSGHFRLEATFTNVSGESTPVAYKDPTTGETLFQKTDVYLPLVIQPYDWKFDNQVFFNLQTDPMAVVIPKPDVTQPGWTIPLFPPATDAKQSIWVEADVKDFQMPALALVIAFVFPETNQANALDQLGPGLNDLYGGIQTLDAGLNTAVAGLGSAATPDTLIYGIGQIYDGLLQLSAEGIGLLEEGVTQMESGVNGQLIPGTYQAYYGMDTLVGGLGGAQAAVSQLQAGIDQVMLGISTGDPSNPGIKEALQAMASGINTELIPGLQLMRAGIGPASTSGTLLNQLNQLIAMFSADNFPTPPPNSTMYAYVNHNAVYGGTMNGQDTAVLNGMMSALTGQLTAALPQIQLMYNMLGDGSDPDTVIGGLFYMSSVLTYLVNNIGTAATPDTLLNGLAQIQMGLVLLGAGLGEATDGATQIKYGLNGAPIGQDGILQGLQQVSGGLSQVNGGLAQIDTTAIGSASTPDTLLYGANLVQNGMVELQGGLTQATEEGTQVMITGLDGSLKTINLTNGELLAIQARAEKYNAFLGEPTDGESMMRFIYQTPAVYSYSEGNSTSHWVAIILSIIIALGLVLAGALIFRKLA
jgi:hypothetical protein